MSRESSSWCGRANFAVQGSSANAKQGSSSAFISAGSIQNVPDILLFHLCQGQNGAGVGNGIEICG